MDRTKCAAMQARVKELLAPMEAEFGVKIGGSRASYGDGNVEIKVPFGEIAEGGIVLDKEASALRQLAGSLGFDGDPVGREFALRGRTFTLLGYYPRSSKYPFKAKAHDDGKTYKLPGLAVRDACGAKIDVWERTTASNYLKADVGEWEVLHEHHHIDGNHAAVIIRGADGGTYKCSLDNNGDMDIEGINGFRAEEWMVD